MGRRRRAACSTTRSASVTSAAIRTSGGPLSAPQVIDVDAPEPSLLDDCSDDILSSPPTALSPTNNDNDFLEQYSEFFQTQTTTFHALSLVLGNPVEFYSPSVRIEGVQHQGDIERFVQQEYDSQSPLMSSILSCTSWFTCVVNDYISAADLAPPLIGLVLWSVPALIPGNSPPDRMYSNMWPTIGSEPHHQHESSGDWQFARRYQGRAPSDARSARKNLRLQLRPGCPCRTHRPIKRNTPPMALPAVAGI
jgi:hypothetical protein